MNGSIGILNVGAGDTKLTFDKSNPAECIRAARIVTDMLRRGYALLIEVDMPDGKKIFRRATEFSEATCEYIIADLDPVTAAKVDAEETNDVEVGKEDESSAAETAEGNRPPKPSKLRKRAIHASSTRAVAVSRSAGG